MAWFNSSKKLLLCLVLSDFFIFLSCAEDFTIEYTKINGNVECARIFAKILNPIAFKLKKKGTIKGNLSKNTIILSDLQYNRLNWRDELSGKDKSQTRKEYEPTLIGQLERLATYTVNKAKKSVKKYLCTRQKY